MGFRVNRPAVVHEEFEDEIVVVNLDTGRYYSMRDVAAHIWRAIDAGAAEDEVVSRIAAAYDAPLDSIEVSVAEFLAKLETETLVARGLADAPCARPADRAAVSDRAPFTAPVLETYADMQDLLVLDPIHEVDETGWPTPKPPGDQEA